MKLGSLVVAALAAPVLGDDSRAKAKSVVAKMTIEEKIALTHGTGWGKNTGGYVGRVAGIPKLSKSPGDSVPDLRMNDGSCGYHCGGLAECPQGSTTAFPSSLNVAATWDPGMARAWGSALGKEFYAKRANVQLGPGTNIARTPVGGRNHEFMSGEDPVLGARLVNSAVQGIQGEGVIATSWDYVLNNQEWNRNTVSVSVDERTFMELYLPPFQGAVDAEVGSIMCSYNLINGTHSCSNNGTLNRFLKEETGFDGFVQSDWNGAHRPLAIVNGLDTEMPGSGELNNNTIHTLLANGNLTEARLDDAATRVVTALYRVGAMGKNNTVGNLTANVTTDYSRTAAQGVAEDSAVLLKNNGVLPIKKGQKVLLAGTWAPSFGGWGSGLVEPSYAPSWMAEMGARQDPPTPRLPFLNAPVDSSNPQTVNTMNDADVIVVVVVTRSGEGFDRQNITFSSACPHNWCDVRQDAIVENITRIAGKKTVVIGLSTGTVLTPWADAAGAVILDWMPGQYYAPALTRLLYGDVIPSGKLPVTIPNKVNEEGWTEEQYPGVYIPPCTPRSRDCGPVVTYSEGLFVGYRWYDKHGVAPKFPFGHGLSYTTFEYKGLRMQKRGDGAMVWATVSNSGAEFAGREVAQVYLTFPGNDPFEPKSMLKAFNKTALLQPGQSVELSFTLSERDLSFWLGGRWVKQTGAFKVAVGSSSRDLRLTGTLTV